MIILIFIIIHTEFVSQMNMIISNVRIKNKRYTCTQQNTCFSLRPKQSMYVKKKQKQK